VTVLQGAGPPEAGKSMAAEVNAADPGGRRRTGHGGRLAGSDDVEADNAVNEEKTGSKAGCRYSLMLAPHSIPN